MAIEDLRAIGNVLYRVAQDGTLYPVRRMQPDEAPTRRQPTAPGLLSGTGILERAGMLNQILNPVEAIGGSMQASERMLAPDTAGWDRAQAMGDMLSGVAGVAAPAALTGRAGAPAATAMMEGLLGWSPTGQAAVETARSAGRTIAERANLPGPVPTMYSNPVPGLLGDTLPAPRNGAEAIAKNILEQRATGDVSGVTEEMMAAADPQYMYTNTPLPMDEASRIMRAKEMGAVDEYHGTTSGGEMRYPSSAYGSGSRKGIGFVTSSDPYVASSYAAPDFGGTVFPMLNKSPQGGFSVVNTNGDLWSNIPSDARVVLPNGRETTVASYASVPDDYTGGYRTDFLSRGAAIEGDGGIKFENIIDRGIHIPRVKDDQSVALAFQRESSKPSSVMFRHDTRGMRSRFARFDPIFSHLRNLSAGVTISPLAYGLLSDPTDRGRNQ